MRNSVHSSSTLHAKQSKRHLPQPRVSDVTSSPVLPSRILFGHLFLPVMFFAAMNLSPQTLSTVANLPSTMVAPAPNSLLVANHVSLIASRSRRMASS